MSGSAGAPVVLGGGAFCAVGRGLAQVDASVRAGLARFSASSVIDRRFEPMVLSLVPGDALEPLLSDPDIEAFPVRRRRLLSLAAPALREALGALPPGALPPPLFLGLAETAPGEVNPSPRAVAAAFATQAGVLLDLPKSQIFAAGRAAALLALEAAVRALAEGSAERVLVGGVDSHFDMARLGLLDAEDRIKGAQVMDGFIPGEGAAFVLLAKPAGGKSARDADKVRVLGVGKARDPGHLYSKEPARGEGLANAMDVMFAQPEAKSSPPARTTYAGLNGENFGAKEWGVANIRHRARFDPQAALLHPAQSYGDAGAATGALLLAVASAALAHGAAEGPALVWASSDREDCACALLQAPDKRNEIG